MTNRNGRPTYYGQRMIKKDVRLPGDYWDRLGKKSKELTASSDKKITISDLIRTAVKRLLESL